MPKIKKSTRKTSDKKPTKPSKAKPGLSYETHAIITVLFLLFFYPVGLILMWWWMKNWPFWLKLIITIPLIFGVLVFFALMIFIATLISHIHSDRRLQENLSHRMILQKQIVTTITPTQTY